MVLRLGPTVLEYRPVELRDLECCAESYPGLEVLANLSEMEINLWRLRGGGGVEC